MIDLLGRERAIVLCGHLHKYSLLVRRCSTGKFVQLAVSSIIGDAPAAREPQFHSAADYGPDLTDLEPAFSVDTLASRRQVLANEKPFIEKFEYALHSGFATLSINDDDIRATIYDGADSGRVWRAVGLSELLV